MAKSKQWRKHTYIGHRVCMHFLTLFSILYVKRFMSSAVLQLLPFQRWGAIGCPDKLRLGAPESCLKCRLPVDSGSINEYNHWMKLIIIIQQQTPAQYQEERKRWEPRCTSIVFQGLLALWLFHSAYACNSAVASLHIPDESLYWRTVHWYLPSVNTYLVTEDEQQSYGLSTSPIQRIWLLLHYLVLAACQDAHALVTLIIVFLLSMACSGCTRGPHSHKCIWYWLWS